MGQRAARYSLDALYPGIEAYQRREEAKSKHLSTGAFFWWSRAFWESAFYLPIRKEAGLTEAEIGRCSLARIFELRESLGQHGAIQGFLMDARMQTPKKGKAPKTKETPVFKNIEDVQRFLHQEQGFGRVISGR